MYRVLRRELCTRILLPGTGGLVVVSVLGEVYIVDEGCGRTSKV